MVLQLESSLCSCIRYLIFFAIEKTACIDNERLRSPDTLHIGQIDTHSGSHRNDDPVLRNVTKFIDGEEQVVCSSVRLETAEKSRDFFRESLATTTYATFEVSSGFTEGEVDLIDRQISKSSNCNSGQFKGRPQVLNHLNCVLCRSAWERFSESQLVMFVNAVRIRLNERNAWCPPEINPEAPFKVAKSFFSPLESKT